MRIFSNRDKFAWTVKLFLCVCVRVWGGGGEGGGGKIFNP